MTVVTRIAPSPTGYMHIGTARTALYNWLYARRHNGKFHLRIEDTDRARHSEEAVLAIVNGMKWLGLEWDGEVVSQYERRERHAEIARALVKNGHAYYCYCSSEELEDMRETARQEGRSVVYDRRWRDRDPVEAPDDVDPVIRIKAPLDGETTIHDTVQGNVSVLNRNLDDFVLLRSDGSPTYMLSVVVDDHDMHVTHVIRGDDHLNNAFRQNLIYDAMGWPVPHYAHLPLILGEDGKKLSKRHGAQSVSDFRDMGYVPEAVRNYLLRLGWSHGDEEIIPTAQAVEWFNLDSIGQAAAQFDFKKLDSLNAHYIAHMDDQDLLDLVTPFLERRHGVTVQDDETVHNRLIKGMPELKERAKSLLQLTDEASFYAHKIPYDFDDKAQEILSGDALDCIVKVREALKNLNSFTTQDVQAACKEVAKSAYGGKLGKVGMPLRAAITGTTVSPSIFSATAILGQKETQKRLEYTLDYFNKKKQKKSGASH